MLKSDNQPAPVIGQPAAIVTSSQGRYLARFPAHDAGSMDKAKAAAEAWRKANAPGSTVREFTGTSLLIWNDAQGLRDLFRAVLTAGLTAGDVRSILAENDQEKFADEIAQAIKTYASDDIEIDDTPEVSPAADGVWVAAWVWVRDGEVAPDDDEDEEQEA